MQKPDFQVSLKAAGFKVTPARVSLLEALWREQKPLAVDVIAKKVKGKMNEVTLYRALEALADKGIIRRVDLGHAHAHYEMEKKHHHHVVCTDCGSVEDINNNSLERAVAAAGRQSRRFKSIYSHNVEFFGQCKSCAN